MALVGDETNTAVGTVVTSARGGCYIVRSEEMPMHHRGAAFALRLLHSVNAVSDIAGSDFSVVPSGKVEGTNAISR